MKLEEAIGKVSFILLYRQEKGYSAGNDALKLLIEAGKRCQYADRINFDGSLNLLPGETKD